jgi:16S rRNA (guanine527-N7)-methyltransferase
VASDRVQSGAELGALLGDAAASLGLELGEQGHARLLRYLALLQRWNSHYNLTAVREPQAMLTQHLVDCLAVLPALRAELPVDGALRVLDVGSGGGLPGVVLALLQPTWQVDCVDTVGKKAAFIRQVAADLQLPNLTGLHARVESLDRHYELITCRAFAALPLFVSLTRHLLAPEGRWAAMKGRVPEDELKALPSDIDVFHVKHLEVPGLDAERCLIWMRPRQR